MESLADLVALVVGVAIAIPLVSFAVTAAIAIVALQIAIIGAILGYLIGIPWSIWFRIRHGRWPEA